MNTFDLNGNAIIAIEDMRGGSGFSHVSVCSVAPDGHAVWDTNGIQLGTGLFNSYSPTVCLTNSQNVLVAWNAATDARDTNQGWFLMIRKLTPDGNLLWPEPITVAGPDSNYIFPSLLPVGQEDFIMVWEKKFETGTGLGRKMYSSIYAMRYDTAGNECWPQPVPICDHGDTAYVMPEFFRLFLYRIRMAGYSWPGLMTVT